jgi:urea transport system permease protein
LAAHASDAEDFLAANPPTSRCSKPGPRSPIPRASSCWNALQQGQSRQRRNQTVRLNNRLRGLIDNAWPANNCSPPTPTRLAARQLQKAQPAQMAFLDRRFAAEQDADVHAALSLALANLQLGDSDPPCAWPPCACWAKPATRWPAPASKPAQPGRNRCRVRTAAETSLAQVKRKLLVGELLGQAFSGLSLGSILLLAALGLAITFGLLGVINMAHGEMLMLGAYAPTWCRCCAALRPRPSSSTR